MARFALQVCTMLQEDDLAFVDAHAAKRRVSRSDVIREGIAELRERVEREERNRDITLLQSPDPTAAAS